ncbi:MAG: beta-propeller fold lactonase family protein [Planctomycetes bacterium]|nr:beta-propeller fold lactonase family protein [Planctomycetota bacterium]
MSFSPHSRFHSLFTALAYALVVACGNGGGHHAPSALPPSALVYPTSAAIFVVDLDAPSLAPSVEGVVERFTVQPSLPDGLAIDERTGTVHGRPKLVAETRSYSITATNAGGSTSTALELTVAPAPRFAYALSGVDSTITLFGVDPESGRLLRKGFEPARAPARGAEQLAVHPNEAFLYVPSSGTQDVAVYAIDPLEGWLTPRASAAAGPGPHRIALHPSGRFAFVVSRALSELFVFDVDAVTGELEHPRAPLACGSEPTDVTTDPAGRFLFVAYTGDGASGAGVQAYAIDAATGAIDPSGGPVALDGLEPSGLRVDPARNAVYVTLSGSDSVLPIRFHQTTGALAALTPDATGDGPDALVFDPLGRFTFVANGSGANVSSYRVDDLSGQLIPSGTTDAGAEPSAVAIDSAGRFLYVANKGSSDVMLYRVGEHDGALARVDAWAVRSAPVDFVLVRGPKAPILHTRFLHVANAGSSDVSAYTVDATTSAAIERLPASPTSAGPSAIALHPRHPFAYVAERDGRALGSYRVDGASGALTPLGPAELVDGLPWCVAIEPSGRFLHLALRDVVALDDGWLRTYAIDVTDGQLHFVSGQPIGSRPVFVGTEPTGRFLFVAHIGAPSSIQAFALDAVTGVPTTSGAPAPAPGVHSLAFHPSGRHLVAALRTSNTIVRYAIDEATGAATAIAGGSRAGREPVAIAFTPDGCFACAAYADSLDVEDGGHVALFRVGPDGALVPPGVAYHDGAHPTCLAVSPDGRLVYAANAGTNDLSTFVLDPASATLHALAPASTGLDPRALVLTPETR